MIDSGPQCDNSFEYHVFKINLIGIRKCMKNCTIKFARRRWIIQSQSFTSSIVLVLNVVYVFVHIHYNKKFNLAIEKFHTKKLKFYS